MTRRWFTESSPRGVRFSWLHEDQHVVATILEYDGSLDGMTKEEAHYASTKGVTLPGLYLRVADPEPRHLRPFERLPASSLIGAKIEAERRVIPPPCRVNL